MGAAKSGGMENALTHIVYDKTTGRILATHRSYDLREEQFRESDRNDVLSMFKRDPAILSRATDEDAGQLSVLTTKIPHATALREMRVSPKHETLVSRPRLRLRSDREALEGNGEDSVSIFIDVVNNQGEILRDYQGEVHVTTSRGKLSARGGRVNVERGQGKFTLTSGRETVDKVDVHAATTDGSALSHRIALSFE